MLEKKEKPVQTIRFPPTHAFLGSPASTVSKKMRWPVSGGTRGMWHFKVGLTLLGA